MKSMWIKVLVGVALMLLVATAGCERTSTKFALPEGDVERGEVAYAALQCNACHSRTDSPSQGVEGIDIPLGGTVSKVDSYATLVTSIINPSHRIKRSHQASGELPDGESAMQNYNDMMTVQELIDLVALLQAEYNVIVPVYPYGIYQ